jgi:hypothetical protein
MHRAALRQVPSKYFSFPCHSFIPLTAAQPSPSIIQGWYSRPINGRGRGGLGSTPAAYINTEIKSSVLSITSIPEYWKMVGINTVKTRWSSSYNWN